VKLEQDIPAAMLTSDRWGVPAIDVRVDDVLNSAAGCKFSDQSTAAEGVPEDTDSDRGIFLGIPVTICVINKDGTQRKRFKCEQVMKGLQVRQ